MTDDEANRDGMLTCVLHDLKSPLTAIQGWADLAYAQVISGEKPEAVDACLARKLEGIIEATSAMEAMIEELRDIGSMQRGAHLDLKRNLIDLVALACQVAERFDATTAHRVIIQTTVATLIGRWDAVRLERVVTNLIDNAIKYSPADEKITMRLRQDDDAHGSWAVLQVCDHGWGIPAADLPYIFEPLRRAGNVAGRVAGTGLGLASVKGIVEQHGGVIAVSSQEGVGTVVTVRLPLRR